MHTYLYEDSFDGFLTALFDGYRDTDVVAIVPADAYQPDIFSVQKNIPAQQEKARRIYDSVCSKLSYHTLQNLYYLYLGELPGHGLLALEYLRLCYTKGVQINFAKQHPVIAQVDACRYKVTYELQRIKGFLRFQEIAPLVFYGKIEPDHHQLPLLESHLRRRYSDQKMIVHDVKRKKALVYDLNQSIFVPFSQEEANALLEAGTQDNYIALFRQYFQAANIPERCNPRLQLNYMPRRYRKHMPETF